MALFQLDNQRIRLKLPGNSIKENPMAKDDYDYLVFRILTYLYVCFRRRGYFETSTFLKRVISPEVSEDYLIDVLRFMTRENLIDGLTFVRAWGNDYTLISDYSDMEITPQGIRYLLDNDKMRQLKGTVLESAPSAIFDLVKLAF